MQGMQWIGLGELPNDLFGMQRQWLQRQLGNARSAGSTWEDQDDAVWSLSRDGVCGSRTSLFSLQRNRATLERWAAGPTSSRAAG